MARAGNKSVHVAFFQHHRAEIRAVFQKFFRLIGRHSFGSAQFAKARVVSGKFIGSQRIYDGNARKVRVGVCLFNLFLVAEKHDFRNSLFRRVRRGFHHAGIFALAKHDGLFQGFRFFFNLFEYVFH